MGRIKSLLPKGSFSLKASPNGKGECPIYLKYYVEGKYAKRSMDIWVLPKEWETVTQKVSSANKSAARLNAYLELQKRKVDDQLVAYDGGVITWSIVQQMLDGDFLPENEKAKTVLFVDYCQKVNQIRYDRDDIGYTTYYNAKRYIIAFERFLRDEKKIVGLTLNNISKEYIDDFVAYRKDKQAKRGSDSNDAINKSIAPLIKAVQYAKDNGQIDLRRAQAIISGCYLDINSRVYNPDDLDDDEVNYLDDTQLKAFIEYQPRSNRASATKDIMELFLFSMYSCGLRISDLVTLEWSNVDFEGCKINKIQVKSKRRGLVSPRLSKEAISILNDRKARGLNSRFVFNYLPEDFVFSKENSEALRNRTNSVDKNVNQSLRHIGEKLGLPFPLTIHVARHTFCVKALSSGMSLHIVSQLMGHSSILATEKTYARYLDSKVDEEIDKLYDLF